MKTEDTEVLGRQSYTKQDQSPIIIIIIIIATTSMAP